MTKLHPGLEDLFGRVGAQIYDSADKKIDGMILLSELLATGEVTNWSKTPHFDHINNKIWMPEDCEDYDRVAAHELIHWTGHKSRTGRYKGYHSEVCCGQHAYHLEELVAELGSLMLCERFGITSKDNRKRMIAGWRSTFRGSQTHTKKEAYAIAMRDAEKAVAYILSLVQMERKAA